MAHTITWEPKGVYKRFTGFVSFEEFIRTQEEVLADPRIDSMRYVINDFLAVEGYTATREQAEYSAAINRGSSFSNPRLRVACVTTQLPVKALITVASLVSALEIKGFASLDAARTWCSGAG